MGQIKSLCGMMILLVTMTGTVSAQDEDLSLRGVQQTGPQSTQAPLGVREIVRQIEERTSGGLSTTDVEQLLGQVNGHLDPSGALSVNGTNRTESEIARQLSLLRKIEQELFSRSPGESVESLFDAEFGGAPARTSIDAQKLAELIAAYDQLHTRLHAMKTYAFLAQGPITTYKGSSGSEDVVNEARQELERARNEAKTALGTLSALVLIPAPGR